VDMQNKLSAKGRRMVTIIDPHIKRDSSYRVHTDAQAQDLYVKDHTGKTYEGWCWPGSVSYLDFLNPNAQDYWASQFALDKYIGSTQSLFTWNDMNEPSVFNGPEVTMKKDCLHYGDVEHRDVHNLYGFHVQRASYHGLLKRDDKRPFVLTRSFFAGSQRYGAMWTGDNKADWDHLKAATPMLLSLAVTGFSFVGADVGGFFGDPDAELLLRWYQAAAYTPFFRGHGHIDTKRREPWLFGEPWTSHNRKAIQSRYKVLPYLYTIFYRSYKEALPVIMPLWAEYPWDDKTYTMDDQFLLGSDLLIKPVTDKGANTADVYFPMKNSPWFWDKEFEKYKQGPHTNTSIWYDVETYTKYISTGSKLTVPAPLDKIPVYQRGGSVLPMRWRTRRNSKLMRKDPYTLRVCVDAENAATGLLYLDDGETFDFKKGKFNLRQFDFVPSTDKDFELSSSSLSDTDFAVPNTVERVVLVGLSGKLSRVSMKMENAAAKELTFYQDTNSITVRKPDVNIGSDWTISFKFE